MRKKYWKFYAKHIEICTFIQIASGPMDTNTQTHTHSLGYTRNVIVSIFFRFVSITTLHSNHIWSNKITIIINTHTNCTLTECSCVYAWIQFHMQSWNSKNLANTTSVTTGLVMTTDVFLILHLCCEWKSECKIISCSFSCVHNVYGHLRYKITRAHTNTHHISISKNKVNCSKCTKTLSKLCVIWLLLWFAAVERIRLCLSLLRSYKVNVNVSTVNWYIKSQKCERNACHRINLHVYNSYFQL